MTYDILGESNTRGGWGGDLTLGGGECMCDLAAGLETNKLVGPALPW